MSDKLNIIIKKTYVENNNYKIEYSEGEDNSSCVAVYFSSNAIFYPDNEAVFTDTIVVKDRYEWNNNRIKRANKHVFVRDIYKSWYLFGINSKLHNIESLCEFIKRETKGYKEIVIVGSSAGAYVAILIGTMIRANMILGFSPQWNLYDENIAEKLHRKRPDLDIKNCQKYYDLTKYGDYESVFYFVPIFSEEDIIQLSHAERLTNIHIIKIESNQHGVAIPYETVQYIINLPKRKLIKLQDKKNSDVSIIWKVMPYKKSIILLIHYLKDKIKSTFLNRFK